MGSCVESCRKADKNYSDKLHHRYDTYISTHGKHIGERSAKEREHYYKINVSTYLFVCRKLYSILHTFIPGAIKLFANKKLYPFFALQPWHCVERLCTPTMVSTWKQGRPSK